MIITDNPVSKVFARWSEGIAPVVGKGNYSMSNSHVLMRSDKYARIFMLGNPTSVSDLEGDECATTASFQVDTFASGPKALSAVYDIDSSSHAILTDMGFRRSYGPSLWEEDESGIQRLTSRYSRVYAGTLLGEVPP